MEVEETSNFGERTHPNQMDTSNLAECTHLDPMDTCGSELF